MPYEVLEMILSDYSVSSLRNSQFVCKSWYLVVNNAPIWHKLAKTHGFDLAQLKASQKDWQFRLFMASKISSGKARKEKPLKAHTSRTTCMYSLGPHLITLGSNELPDSKENEWDFSAKVAGLFVDPKMKISLTVWDTRVRERVKCFALEHQVLPKVHIDQNQLFVATLNSGLQIWDFNSAKLVTKLIPPSNLSTITGFHVTERTIYVLAGREDAGQVHMWRRDEGYRYAGLLEVTNHRYNLLDGYNETIVLSSKTAIHFYNTVTLKKTSISLPYQVFPSTAKIESGMLFIEQGGHTMGVYNVLKQELRCNLYKSMRILQVNSNLRVHEHYVFVTDMGKIRVFDLDTSANVQTIEEPTSVYYLVSGLQVRGDLLIFAVVDAGIKVWDWRKKLLIATHPQKIYNSTFSQSGDLVLIDQCVYLSSIFHGSIDVWRFGAKSQPYQSRSSSSSSSSSESKDPIRPRADVRVLSPTPVISDR
jgi:hypothetical protein